MGVFTSAKQTLVLFFLFTLLFTAGFAGAALSADFQISIQSPQIASGKLTMASAPGSYSFLATRAHASQDMSAFKKWSNMRERRARIQIGEQERLQNEWFGNIRKMNGLPLIEKIHGVNNWLNRQAYIEDSRNWGRADYWATPLEFLARGGDCEDYAIAKYAALAALGVEESRLRLAIVKDLKKNIPHAVLLVLGDNETFVLDNQETHKIRAASFAGRYKPIYAINRQAWWLHRADERMELASR